MKKKVITECFEIVTISDLEPETILDTKKQVLLQVRSTNSLEGDHTYTFKKQSSFFYYFLAKYGFEQLYILNRHVDSL